MELALYPRVIPEIRKDLSLPHTKLPDPNNSVSSQVTLEQTLKAILPSEKEESAAIKTRRLLGETVHTLSDEQIEVITTEFQFLADTWLDEFETKIFSKTLKEVLHEQ